MKQHITVDQLNELSEKGKDKLRKWYRPQVGDMYFITWFDNKIGSWTQEEFDLISRGANLDHNGDINYFRWPFLSIGQMIEFLDEQVNGLVLDFTLINGCVDGNAYINGETLSTLNPKQFCDALWEAVKEVLEVDKIEKKE